ncbi:CCR4-associated factor 1 [Carex littledalei]|uniref:CCR4-associated factor 1 n=1 Tax=Carex littledalei TaxID=544730 RepID=A0A833RM41_9POAL|nr:CCR4-associated factor 1 [Carex littledalei]
MEDMDRLSHLGKSCKGLYGDLERIAGILNVQRAAGLSHRAGSEGLLTWDTFRRMKAISFRDGKEQLAWNGRGQSLPQEQKTELEQKETLRSFSAIWTPMSSKQEGPRIQDKCDTTGWLIMLMMIPVKRIAVPYGMGVLQRMQGLQFWSAA